MRLNSKIIVWGVLVSIYLLLEWPWLNKPFIGHHDWNGVQYANMARNYLRYGFVITRFGQIENAGVVGVNNFAYNTHHLATFPILLSVIFRIMGVGEWQSRLLPMLASMLSIAMVIRLVARLTNANLIAFLAGALLIVTPMWRYFSIMPVHEPLILAMGLLTIDRFLAFFDGKGSWGQLFGANLMTQLLGWPGFYLSGYFILYAWLSNKKYLVIKLLPLIFSGVLVFVGHLLHNYLITGNAFGGGLLDVLMLRLNQAGDEVKKIYGFSLLEFIMKQATWVKVYFTITQVSLCVLALFWLIVRNKYSYLFLVGLLFGYGFSHAVIFPNAAWIHEYMIYYAAPAFAITATIGAVQLGKQFRIKGLTGGLLGLLLIIGCFGERQAFYLALANSSFHDQGRKVGLEINERTSVDEGVVVVANNEYVMNLSKFSAYYADRNINWIYNLDEYKSFFMVKSTVDKSLVPHFCHELEYTYDCR